MHFPAIQKFRVFLLVGSFDQQGMFPIPIFSFFYFLFFWGERSSRATSRTPPPSPEALLQRVPASFRAPGRTRGGAPLLGLVSTWLLEDIFGNGFGWGFSTAQMFRDAEKAWLLLGDMFGSFCLLRFH